MKKLGFFGRSTDVVKRLHGIPGLRIEVKASLDILCTSSAHYISTLSRPRSNRLR